MLFNDSIYYNIAYGNVYATKQDVEEAARMADLDKVIRRMPLGYETQVTVVGCFILQHKCHDLVWR